MLYMYLLTFTSFVGKVYCSYVECFLDLFILFMIVLFTCFYVYCAYAVCLISIF